MLQRISHILSSSAARYREISMPCGPNLYTHHVKLYIISRVHTSDAANMYALLLLLSFM